MDAQATILAVLVVFVGVLDLARGLYIPRGPGKAETQPPMSYSLDERGVAFGDDMLRPDLEVEDKFGRPCPSCPSAVDLEALAKFKSVVASQLSDISVRMYDLLAQVDNFQMAMDARQLEMEARLDVQQRQLEELQQTARTNELNRTGKKHHKHRNGPRIIFPRTP
ncbi:uncharacterized protein [Branchiostoma lanceolatum]|uniref:uncharacterized protein n=1 Tax=Branchiostoma lanceolatum TaxID=7740 RepID=UPI0034563618